MDTNPPDDNSDSAKIKELENELKQMTKQVDSAGSSLESPSQPAVQTQNPTPPEDLGDSETTPVGSVTVNENPETSQTAPTNFKQPTNQTPPIPENPSGKMKPVIYIAIFLFVMSLLGLGAYFVGAFREGRINFSRSTPTPVPTAVSTLVPQPTVTPDPTESWETFSTSTYRVKYPSDMKVVEGEGGLVTLSVVGPTQTEDTELFDGISMSFQSREAPDESLNLQSLTNSLINDIKTQGVGEVISGPDTITVGEYRGLTFTVEGLGTYKHLVLDAGDGMVFMTISVLVADPGELNFQATVDQILSTLDFISSDGSTMRKMISPSATPCSGCSQ